MSNLIKRKTQFVPAAAVLSLLGALACLLALTFLFGLVSVLPALHRTDVALLLKIHGFHPPWLDAVMLALTQIGAIKIFTIALATVLAGLLWRDHRRAAGILAYAVTGALILNYTFKELFHRARPELPWSLHDEPTFSFPSGHAFFSVTLYGTLCWLALRRGISPWRVVPVALALPFAIGLSRIYLGEHYPTDVLAGWLCGALWTATVIRVARIWPRHSTRPKRFKPQPTQPPPA